MSEVGYVFAEAFENHDAAMSATEKYAVLASMHSDRHTSTADVEFAVQ